MRFRSIFGSWRGGGVLCLFFEVTALLKKGSPIYRKTAIYRAFDVFSEYVFQYVLLFPLSLKCHFRTASSPERNIPPLPFALTHPLYA